MKSIKLHSYFLLEDNSVEIEWEESEGLEGVFKSTKLTISFDTKVSLNSDIAAFIFLNIIVPCYHHTFKEPIEISFKDYVSPEIIDGLKQYHNLNQAKFVNRNSIEEQKTKVEELKKTDYAIFYGGGKDSLLSAAIHQDLFGADNVTLLRLIWDEDSNRLSKKREIIEEPLEFMAEKGFKYEYVQSNFHSIIANRDVGKIPNIALYPGLMAPLLALRGFKQLSHGYDAALFHMPASKNRELPFKVVRPENLKILAKSLSKITSEPLIFKNYNYGFNAGVAFKFLANAYPEYLPNIYMCERLSGKWCIKCRKCFFYALACLAYKCPSDFNLGYFFQNSQYVKDLVSEVQEEFGSAVNSINHVQKFAHPTHLCSTIQVAHDIDLNYARDRLWNKSYNEAFLNLLKIIEPFKNYSFPDFDAFWARAYDEDMRQLGGDEDGLNLEAILIRLKEASIPVSYKYKFNGFNGRVPVVYDFLNGCESKN